MSLDRCPSLPEAKGRPAELCFKLPMQGASDFLRKGRVSQESTAGSLMI